jgi:hypothetical protein
MVESYIFDGFLLKIEGRLKPIEAYLVDLPPNLISYAPDKFFAQNSEQN